MQFFVFVLQVVLNENNDLWVEYRHAHIGLVLREVSSHYNDLIKNFKGASELAQGKGGSMSLEEMRQATQGLPEFQVCCPILIFVLFIKIICVLFSALSTYATPFVCATVGAFKTDITAR